MDNMRTDKEQNRSASIAYSPSELNYGICAVGAKF